MFCARYPDVPIQLNVTRRPYSFGKGSRRGKLPGPQCWKYYDGLAGFSATVIWPILTDLQEMGISLKSLETSVGLSEALSGIHKPHIIAALRHAQKSLGVEPVDEQFLLKSMAEAEDGGRVGRVAFGSQLTALDCAIGDLKVEKFKASGLCTSPPINFNMDVDFQWEPIDSQRLLLWAKEDGKQDIVAKTLFHLHFEQRQSLSWRSTLLTAAQAAGIDEADCASFLDGDYLRSEVLEGYDQHMRCGIHWPPFFALNGPGSNGGPFRDGTRSCMVVRGSAKAFAEAFEQIWSDSAAVISSTASPHDQSLSRHDQAWKWKRARGRQDMQRSPPNAQCSSHGRGE